MATTNASTSDKVKKIEEQLEATKSCLVKRTEALNAFATVIKANEAWTSNCQKIYESAMIHSVGVISDKLKDYRENYVHHSLLFIEQDRRTKIIQKLTAASLGKEAEMKKIISQIINED